MDPLTTTADDWDLDEDEIEGNGGELGYDDDGEDEFGLPSLASIRGPSARPSGYHVYDPGERHRPPATTNMAFDKTGSYTRPRANSADIAEERSPPSFPATATAKVMDTKILRPQYKEILRGERKRLSRCI